MPSILDKSSIVLVNSADRINIDYPANTPTSVLYAIIAVHHTEGGGTPTITTPSGWTLINSGLVFQANSVVSTYWRLGGVSGVSTFVFGGAYIYGEGAILSLADCHQTSPYDGPTSTGTSGTSHSALGITASVQNELLIASWVGYLLTPGFSLLSSMTQELDNPGGLNPSSGPLLIASEQRAASGSTGSRTATTPISGAARVGLIGFKPYPGPSVPVLTYPNGGESLTVGAVVQITWNPSTSATAAQSTLKYNLDYSTNNGGSWTQIVALTSAGVTSYAWTVPSVVGTGNLIRIRSNDPALALFSLGYDQSDSAFSIVTETTPGQPTITAPSTGSAHNKAVNITVSWMHQGGLGNPQTEFTLQWDDNAGFSSPTTVGPTATSTQSTSIDFSSLASGTTVYVKVKTKGVSLYSAYSNAVSFVVASAPATPNITAPVAASPPTTPLPTITFTEADPFVARKMRVTVGGIESYNSGEVASSALSFTSGYNFANGVQVVFYLSVKNTYGLWSAEDSETVTAAYTGPATPTIAVQAVSASGYVQIQISNSDSPVYNELWRFENAAGLSTAIKVGMLLPINASFSDRNVASDVVYGYFARAYNGTGLFTDSAGAVVSLSLDTTYLHIISRTSTSSNGTSSISFILDDGTEFGFEETAISHKILNRAKPVGVTGQAVWQVARIVGMTSSPATLAALMAIWRARSLVCLRTFAGHRIFGKMTEPQSNVSVDNVNLETFGFTVTEEDYNEGL